MKNTFTAFQNGIVSRGSYNTCFAVWSERFGKYDFCPTLPYIILYFDINGKSNFGIFALFQPLAVVCMKERHSSAHFVVRTR